MPGSAGHAGLIVGRCVRMLGRAGDADQGQGLRRLLQLGFGGVIAWNSRHVSSEGPDGLGRSRPIAAAGRQICEESDGKQDAHVRSIRWRPIVCGGVTHFARMLGSGRMDHQSRAGAGRVFPGEQGVGSGRWGGRSSCRQLSSLCGPYAIGPK